MLFWWSRGASTRRAATNFWEPQTKFIHEPLRSKFWIPELRIENVNFVHMLFGGGRHVGKGHPRASFRLVSSSML